MPFSGWYRMGFETGSDSGAPGGLSEDELALLILSILEEEGSARGYEVALALEERSDGGIPADPDLVYPLLQLLVDREMIGLRNPEEEKRLYRLTDRGRERVDERRSRIETLWRRARAGDRGFEEEVFGAAMGSVCLCLDSALREVSRAVDEVMDGVFGACCGDRGSQRRHRHRGHGPGCSCC